MAMLMPLTFMLGRHIQPVVDVPLATQRAR
jgi:hypothetical protein